MREGAIIGRPASEYDYEFMVIVPTNGGQYQWIADYEDANPAYNKAEEIGGVVAHNVRISHKKLRQPLDKN